MTGCITDTSVPLSVVGMLTALPNTQLSRRLHKEGRLFYRFGHLDKADPGDACTAGLNFVTLRPRREIMRDFRDTVSAVYAPDAFFDRVRRLGRMLDRPSFPARTLNWRLIGHDLKAFARMAWRMNTRHPELASHFWGTLYDTLRHNPRAIELVVTNIIVYLHLYPFSRFVVGEIDRFIERIGSGRYVDPDPMSVPANGEACATRKLAAVA